MEQIYGETDNRRRGRPRKYDSNVALAQATDLFWKKGYAGTSLDGIAAVTGMNRPSLQAAFGDKRDLYLAALRQYWTAEIQAIRAALVAPTLDQALIRAFDAALSTYFSGGSLVRGCFVVGTAIIEAPGDAEIGTIVAAGFETLDAEFLQRIELAREAGELNIGCNAASLAFLATATMQTLALRSRAGSSEKDLRRLARDAVNVICGIENTVPAS
jgi:AcrR family transcriptional regulator